MLNCGVHKCLVVSSGVGDDSNNSNNVIGSGAEVVRGCGGSVKVDVGAICR